MQLFPSNQTYEEEFGTDAELIASDWKEVGYELRKAREKIDNECTTRSPSSGTDCVDGGTNNRCGTITPPRGSIQLLLVVLFLLKKGTILKELSFLG